MKIALLSNVNMNNTIRILKREIDVYDVEGYGNELGTLLNQNSSLYEYSPEIIFLLEDLQELTSHETDVEIASNVIGQWFEDIEIAMIPQITYYISDAYCFGMELSVVVDTSIKQQLESVWLEKLRDLVSRKNNVRIFPYKDLVEKLGENSAFSMKMWYMGKILHSSEMQRLIAQKIIEKTRLESYIPKKVLLLDLDNTLWGGLAGENDITPIELSDDYTGLIYKNLQRMILQMKKQGVILGIVSKNNESDALQIINNHPHMVLRESDFAIKKINWNNKFDNIMEIASELNVGLDSMVFFDDNPTERQLVMDALPQVAVPEFAEKTEDLPEAMIRIWKQYFDRSVLTKEDLKKTEQYAANVKRDALKVSVGSFEDYLERLEIKLIRKKAEENVERIAQLINKTNQFNLTTCRHTINEVQEMINSPEYEVFAYQVTDRFGDNGLVAVVIVHLQNNEPVIEEFVMSCRVMGKKIEDAIIDDIETIMKNQGYDGISGEYIASNKNMPVSDLYERLGYGMKLKRDDKKIYYISFEDRPERKYKLTKSEEDGL